MERTTNYDQFKLLDYNRKIDQKHVQFLKKLIQIKNRLEFCPIMVNENYEVLDGQHRLQAAKELGLPIWYEVKKSSKPEDVYLLNYGHKPWNVEDAIHYYSEMGVKSYILITEFLRKNKITTSDFLSFYYSNGGYFYRLVKNGAFNITQEELTGIQEIIDKFLIFKEYISEKVPSFLKFAKSKSFRAAFSRLTKLKGFDFDVFMRKLPYCIHLLRPVNIMYENLKIFVSIYNYKSRGLLLELPRVGKHLGEDLESDSTLPL